MLGANRLLIWAVLWVAFGIYWLTQGLWLLTIALLTAAGLLVWQARRDASGLRSRKPTAPGQKRP